MKTRETIASLKAEKNAVILAHNYQPPEIQDLADFCGDSLELSLRASRTSASVIVFCGVRFMAETASIVCPEKTVLLPAPDAGCPMADMITPEALAARKKDLGNMPVVTYVNSPASVKAVSTICCTSANSLKVAESLEETEMLMVPDKNLAAYTAGRTDKTIHPWDGFCPIHDALTAEQVALRQKQYPDAALMVHPECRPAVTALADTVVSTAGMLDYAKKAKKRRFLVGTENGLLYALKRTCPDKFFYPVSDDMICRDMKKIAPADIARSLSGMSPEIKVPEDTARDAFQAVQRMLRL